MTPSQHAPALDRLPTGVPGLDEILDSGLPASAINLILGLPGSGKTLLAHQLMFRNATPERPGLYLSTVSEPFEKILRYGQRLSFFDAGAIGKSVFYDDVGNTLVEAGLEQVGERIRQLLETYEPGLLVIDSFRPLRAFAAAPTDYRRFLHQLAGRLSVRPMSCVLLGEYSQTELLNAPEFAVADGVIWLASARHEEREIRLLQVLKLRGSDYRSGRHAYRISADGLRVFPRLAGPGPVPPAAPRQRPVSTGVKSFDPLLRDAFRPGSTTLLIGPSGIGKTVFGLHFACWGDQGESSVFATFEENPEQIRQAARSFGWSLERCSVHLMYRFAADLYLDEWVYDLLEVIDSTRATRVFVDGLGTLRGVSPDPLRFREYLYSLVQRCAQKGITLMMSIEAAELFGTARLAEGVASQIADNIILLQFVRRDWGFARALTIIKSRASAVEPRTWHYTIGSEGICLAPEPSPA